MTQVMHIPFVKSYRDKRGKRWNYYRRTGIDPVALPGDFGSPEFLAKYSEVHLGTPRRAVTLPVSTLAPQMPPAPVKWRSVSSDGGRIYFIQGRETLRIKIGYSKNPPSRLAELQTAANERLALLGSIPGTIAEEKALHRKFAEYRCVGEWFTGDRDICDYIDEVLKVPGAADRNEWD